MSTDINERLHRLLSSICLKDIKPMSLHFDRVGDMPNHEAELKLEWNQAFADGDPVKVGEDMLIFRPQFTIKVSCSDELIFEHVSKIILAFQILDAIAYSELWADEEVKRAFMESQIRKTMWPFIREYVHDGMSRLALNPVPLPWILP